MYSLTGFQPLSSLSHGSTAIAYTTTRLLGFFLDVVLVCGRAREREGK